MAAFRVVVIGMLAVLLAGCGLPAVISDGVVLKGSGNVITRQMDFRDFSSVEAGSAFRVNISQGSNYSVAITADDNLFDYIRVTKVGSRLQIGMTPNRPIQFRSGTLEAKVTMPELRGVDLSGAAQGTVSGFKSTQNFNGTVSGASHLTGDIAAGSTNLDASGASTLSLKGSATDLRTTGSGASRLELAEFPVNTASVDLSGASSADINVKSTLDYSVSGASHLSYAGTPRIGRSQTSGGSSVSPR